MSEFVTKKEKDKAYFYGFRFEVVNLLQNDSVALSTLLVYEHLRRNLNKCWAQVCTKVTPTSDDLLTSNLFSWEPAL